MFSGGLACGNPFETLKSPPCLKGLNSSCKQPTTACVTGSLRMCLPHTPWGWPTRKPTSCPFHCCRPGSDPHLSRGQLLSFPKWLPRRQSCYLYSYLEGLKLPGVHHPAPPTQGILCLPSSLPCPETQPHQAWPVSLLEKSSFLSASSLFPRICAYRWTLSSVSLLSDFCPKYLKFTFWIFFMHILVLWTFKRRRGWG